MGSQISFRVKKLFIAEAINTQKFLDSIDNRYLLLYNMFVQQYLFFAKSFLKYENIF